MIRGNLSRFRRSVLIAMMAVVAPLAVLGMTSSAYAANHPTGEFAPFNECPVNNSATELCVFAKTESGSFTVGNEKVPIVNAITLQGGIHIGAGEKLEFIGAEDGVTITKTPQKVPGGLAGLVKCNEISNFLERIACELIFENKVTGVNATTELAGSATGIELNLGSLFSQTGTALSLPIKVHLENPFLGSSCYIGSDSHPIVIALTSGTTSPPEPNKPISGSISAPESNPTGQITTVPSASLVNNSYPAPAVEGCGGGLSFLIDPIVDSKLGLPAAAGHNTAILNGPLKLAEAAGVKASE
jgi:hypothetical protein